MTKKTEPGEEVVPLKIVKPAAGFMEKFRSKRPPTIAGVETLLTALPTTEDRRRQRLGPACIRRKRTIGRCELCFVSVPIKGEKRDMLHLIDEEIAVQHLPAKKIKRQRLALASKPHDIFFLCIVPSQNLDNSWNATALRPARKPRRCGCRLPRARLEGVESYKIDYARDPDAFPDPKWPSRTLDELIEVTFRNANIDTDDHPGSAPPDRREARTWRDARVEDCFRTIAVVDFEYEIDDGDLPRVLCMVAYVLDENLRHVGTIRRWRGEFGSTPPFDIGPDTLVVGYSLWAEMTCFLQLGWRFPGARLRSAHRLSGDQQHPAAVQSGREPQEAAQELVGCLPRLRHRGLGEHRQAGNGQGDRRGPLARIRPRGGAAILRGGRSRLGGVAAPSDHAATAIARPSIPSCVMHWSELQRQDRRPDPGPRHADRHAAVESGAGEQAGGHRRADRRFDPSQGSENPIYSPDGEWGSERFAHWLVAAGIAEWPRLDSGALELTATRSA